MISSVQLSWIHQFFLWKLNVLENYAWCKLCSFFAISHISIKYKNSKVFYCTKTASISDVFQTAKTASYLYKAKQYCTYKTTSTCDVFKTAKTTKNFVSKGILWWICAFLFSVLLMNCGSYTDWRWNKVLLRVMVTLKVHDR